MTIRVPPGRGGRLWLRERLATAARATAVLEQKLRTLQEEQHELELRARDTAVAWQSGAVEADRWLVRAELAGGQRAIRLATTADLAEVTIAWTTSMGLTYPVEGRVRPPRDPADTAVLGGGALVRARQAYRDALAAGVAHAVAAAALRVVEREILTTRQRLRALDRRWVPELRQALAKLELALDEQERADGLARRRALRNTTGDS